MQKYWVDLAGTGGRAPSGLEALVAPSQGAAPHSPSGGRTRALVALTLVLLRYCKLL